MILHIKKLIGEEEWSEVINVKIPYGGGCLHIIKSNGVTDTLFLNSLEQADIGGYNILPKEDKKK